jgi:hypothetical protein
MATWNTSLGTPLLAANNAKRQSNLIETSMATGLPRRQRISTLKRTTGTVSFYWTATQKTTWETYFSSTLADGAISITDFPYPLVASNVGQVVYLDADAESVAVPNDLWKVTIPFSAEGRNAT